MGCKGKAASDSGANAIGGISGAGGDVDTAGRNAKAIQEYVRNQLQEDIATEQLCLKEFTDPLIGEPVKKGK